MTSAHAVMAGVLALSPLEATRAVPVEALFHIDPAQSQLELIATLLGSTESSTAPLSGTVSALVDFGDMGSLSDNVVISNLDGEAAAGSDYQFPLGLSTVFLRDGTARPTILIASFLASRVNQNVLDYEFPADSTELVIDIGTVSSVGFLASLVDLTDQPLSGSPEAGQKGQLSLSVISVDGPYSTLRASLSLAIVVDTTIDLDQAELHVQGEGLLLGEAIVVTTLSPIAADFSNDLSVDAKDLLHWTSGFGLTQATRQNGDATGDGIVGGADYLVWQRQFGLTPPTAISSASLVGEPWSATLSLCGWASLGIASRARSYLRFTAAARSALSN